MSCPLKGKAPSSFSSAEAVMGVPSRLACRSDKRSTPPASCTAVVTWVRDSPYAESRSLLSLPSPCSDARSFSLLAGARAVSWPENVPSSGTVATASPDTALSGMRSSVTSALSSPSGATWSLPVPRNVPAAGSLPFSAVEKRPVRAVISSTPPLYSKSVSTVSTLMPATRSCVTCAEPFALYAGRSPARSTGIEALTRKDSLPSTGKSSLTPRLLTNGPRSTSFSFRLRSR